MSDRADDISGLELRDENDELKGESEGEGEEVMDSSEEEEDDDEEEMERVGYITHKHTTRIFLV